jgi:hypothetical protein
MWSAIKGWTFDPYTFLVTAIILPFAYFLIRSLRRHFGAVGVYLFDGALQAISRVATQKIAARTTLRRYCRLQLAGQSKYINVPGAVEVNLEIDRIFVPLILERAGSEETYDHWDMRNAGNRIRIVGDPGSGKSSVSKRLFRDECAGGTRFPIFLESPIGDQETPRL